MVLLVSCGVAFPLPELVSIFFVLPAECVRPSLHVRNNTLSRLCVGSGLYLFGNVTNGCKENKTEDED